MRFSRIYRTPKGTLPLQNLPRAPKKRPASAMTWRPPVHNPDGIQRNFYECVFRAHASCCGCGDLVGHITLLADRYGTAPRPPAPGAPRPQLRRQLALPAAPANPDANPGEPWRGGDGADDGPGGAGGGGVVADAEYQQEELDDLFAALDENE